MVTHMDVFLSTSSYLQTRRGNCTYSESEPDSQMLIFVPIANSI